MSASAQREFALEITHKLHEAGFEALWAGGCVRDQLMGREPKDYDVATNARPEEVQRLFGQRRTLAIGAAFGVIGVLSKDCPIVEVATFRSDGAYLDGRHPSSVVFTTAEHDAQRRDFTINGMFFDPLEDRVIDYVGGQADLTAGIIRAIGDPRARFAEDKLRMLRAVRFATTLNFEIEPATLLAIEEMADEVSVVSAERINAELTRLLTHPRRRLGLVLLHETGLLHSLFPEIAHEASTDSSAWQKMLQNLLRIKSDNISTLLAAMFTEMGNEAQVSEAGRRFRFSNKEIELAVWLSRNLQHVANATELPWPTLQRVLVNASAPELMELARIVFGGENPGVQRCEQYLEWSTERLNPAPLLTGDDLVQHGMQPGPHFGPLLTAIRDAQLEGRIHNQAEALQLARELERQSG